MFICLFFCRDVIKDMQIDREPTLTDTTRAGQIRKILQRSDRNIKHTVEFKHNKMKTMQFSQHKPEKYVYCKFLNTR